MTEKNEPVRRSRDAESTRAALLRGATEVFAEAGYAQGICRVLFEGIAAGKVSP